MKNYIRFLWAVLIIDLAIIGVCTYNSYINEIPSDIKLISGAESVFNFNVPADAYIKNEKLDLKELFHWLLMR